MGGREGAAATLVSHSARGLLNKPEEGSVGEKWREREKEKGDLKPESASYIFF